MVTFRVPITVCFVLTLIQQPVISVAAVRILDVEGQPLAANVERLAHALEFLGATRRNLQSAIRARDSRKIQQLLDPNVLLVVSLNPEVRVKVSRGPAQAVLQQHGYTPVLIKVINDSTTAQALRIVSPQSGPVYAGVAKLSMERQRQEGLRENENTEHQTDRFLDLEIYTSHPMAPTLSGLRVEYAIALIYSSESGRREATIGFQAGPQDVGHGEVPVQFDVRPSVRVELTVKDHNGSPTTGRFLFVDRSGHIYPPQAKRLAPDFFFQKHIYRHDGDTVLLPPGELIMYYGRGPEYRWLRRSIVIPPPSTSNKRRARIEVQLERWINPMDYGFYVGDHHIHAAGCAHYQSPTEGVRPQDMMLQVNGEGLNVGCILTWGPCFDYQHQFFSPVADQQSRPLSILKYDIEVSGFGSQALGHVCLLNLKEQIYPGAKGSQGWPTWTTPVLRWAKGQGAVVGYAHSGSGLQVDATNAARRMMEELDADKDGVLGPEEASRGLLVEPFPTTDSNNDGRISEDELVRSHDRVADQLPNLAVPELNSVGAQEIFVTVPQGLCDFISAMDTARLLEWNCWYHLMNCGFPLKVSGETDFPCMSGTRVGQGRVYVQVGKVDRLDFTQWCDALRHGRSYVSDGYAHALSFAVNGKSPGEELQLTEPGRVTVKAKVAFSSETPIEVAYGLAQPKGGARLVGDTVNFHDFFSFPAKQTTRHVEVVMNGVPVGSQDVPADDRVHELEFSLRVERSSWIALRQFPQLHTNPVNVIIAGKPIRASRDSAKWCIGAIRQLWRARGNSIAAQEREEAKKTFDWAIEQYRKIAEESL